MQFELAESIHQEIKQRALHKLPSLRREGQYKRSRRRIRGVQSISSELQEEVFSPKEERGTNFSFDIKFSSFIEIKDTKLLDTIVSRTHLISLRERGLLSGLAWLVLVYSNCGTVERLEDLRAEEIQWASLGVEESILVSSHWPKSTKRNSQFGISRES